MSIALAPDTRANFTELLLASRVLANSVARLHVDATATERRWERLELTGPYEAWLITWPRGSCIDLHDHGDSTGAMAVVSGVLEEKFFSFHSRGTTRLRSRNLFAGRSVLLPADHVHGITNGSDVPALSLHVYTPRLTEMTYHELRDGTLRPRSTETFGSIAPA
jgi:predicted metal-dependent enzyme (double-stranded beta helix superfamily)